MATHKRPISWFLTDRGRVCSFYVMTSAGIAFAGAKFAPHTFGLSYYKDFVHFYINSKPAPLSEELESRFKKCLDLLNVSNIDRKMLSPFSATGYDVFNAGSCKSRFGAAIGLPVHFSYKSLDDIKKHDIQVNHKKVKWTTDVGKKLADALILPEKVQEFAICREILFTQNYRVHLQSCFPFFSILFAFSFSQAVNRRLNLYAAPTSVRGMLYFLTGTFSLGMYFFLKDYTEVYYESDVDKKLCELGPEYIESGVIFYDKLLKRNQALRELMGKEGEKKYSKMGNENFTIRQPRLALVHRKQFFESKLKELEEAVES